MKIETVRGGPLNLELKELYSLFTLYGDIEEIIITSISALEWIMTNICPKADTDM